MRITIDLPDDLHRQAMSIAPDTSRSLSETVATPMRRSRRQGLDGEIARSAVTDIPTVHPGTAITTDGVRVLEGDQS